MMREYKKGDWLKIEDSVEPFVVPYKADEFDKIAEHGIAVTIEEDGKVMTCGGVLFTSDYEGSVWVKVSRECINRPFLWARIFKDGFKMMLDSTENMNITTYILDGFCRGEKLAKLIKLKKTDESEQYNGKIYNKFMAVI